jgi:hypothetical protein
MLQVKPNHDTAINQCQYLSLSESSNIEQIEDLDVSDNDDDETE